MYSVGKGVLVALFGVRKKEINMDSTLTTVIGVLAGTLLGGFISYLGAVKIAERNTKSQAKFEFYKVLTRSVMQVERSGTTPYHALGGSSHDLCLAAKKFRYHLSSCEQRKFDVAWQEFYETSDEVMFPSQYNNKDAKHDSNVFLKRAESLLKFTNA